MQRTPATAPVLQQQPVDARVRVAGGAVRGRVERVLDAQPLDQRDLRVGVDRGAAQALECDARLERGGGRAPEHAVAVERLAQREQVVGDHPRPQPRPAERARAAHGDHQVQGPDEVRGRPQQPLPLRAATRARGAISPCSR